jgi:DUF4097 and DUF4098 domain-containing protein YvlB
MMSVAMTAHPSLTLTTTSGSIVITSEHRPDVVVDRGDAAIERLASGEVVVQATSSSLDVRCPVGTHVRVGTASGRVELRGQLGDTRVTTKSSSIHVEDVDSLELRTASGSIDVERCVGYCRLQTASGSIEVGEAGHLDITGKSGSIEVGRAAGGRVHTVSGSIEVGWTGENDLDVRAISGSTTVVVPEDARPRVRLRSVSGSARCDCTEGDGCCLDASSVSGSIQVATS